MRNKPNTWFINFLSINFIQNITNSNKNNKFIQNGHPWHRRRPSSASESRRWSWPECPEWFRSRPSSALVLTIRWSDGASHTLFPIEFPIRRNQEGSSSGCWVAIHRRYCANGCRLWWNPGSPEFALVVGFRLIIPFACWIFLLLLAVFFCPFPFLSS